MSKGRSDAQVKLSQPFLPSIFVVVVPSDIISFCYIIFIQLDLSLSECGAVLVDYWIGRGYAHALPSFR
jgi:hypothetical protein